MEELLERIKHFFNPRCCIGHLRVTNEADIQCAVCKRTFGFVYGWKPTEVFVFGKYIRLKSQIASHMRVHAVEPDPFELNVKKNSETLANMIDTAAHYLDNNMVSIDGYSKPKEIDIAFEADEEEVTETEGC